MAKRVLLAGATGLVGSKLLTRLLADERVSELVVIGRRPTEHRHAKLVERIVDFERLDEALSGERFDAVFCALGTTIKAAGSQDAFAKIDLEAVATLAGIGQRAGATEFLLVSSAGANPDSRVFYSRIKGEAERAVVESGMSTVQIFRPSLLLGKRSEHRRGEAFAQAVAPLTKHLLFGPFRRYRAVSADAVAAAMVHAWQQPGPLGVRIHESEGIIEG